MDKNGESCPKRFINLMTFISGAIMESFNIYNNPKALNDTIKIGLTKKRQEDVKIIKIIFNSLNQNTKI